MEGFVAAAVLILCVVVGLGAWCAAGVIILLRRSVYPDRVAAQLDTRAGRHGVRRCSVSSRAGPCNALRLVHSIASAPVTGVILCCHGMSQSREQMLPWAMSLVKAGFHVLLFDFRASGESEGHRATGGFMETQDVLGAVAYISSRPDCEGLPLGALGFSMGGSSSILAAAVEPRIRAVATHAAYATLNSAIAARCKFHFGPCPRSSSSDSSGRPPSLHVQPGEIVPLNAVAKLAPRPLFILHGEKDPIVPPQNGYDLYAAAGGAAVHPPAQRWRSRAGPRPHGGRARGGGGFLPSISLGGGGGAHQWAAIEG